jgi:CRP-like cAMP-binding protein
MIDNLVDVPLFRDLDMSSLEDITGFCSKQHYDDGDILISENDHDNFDIFILSKGNVEIISNCSPTTSGEVVLSNKDCEVFGEISWLTKENRTATVRCIGEVEAIRIDGDAFMRYLESHPQVGFSVLRNLAITLSKRLGTTDALLKQILWNSSV